MHGHGHQQGQFFSPYDHSQPPPPRAEYPRVTTEKRKRRTDSSRSKRESNRPAKRKKMYSDFVGVTYNKTHAKFQACITHYRKQHYLGRYKLAVDAAKAYDQSAKLLKGEGWKINFTLDEEYERAKEKELREVEQKRQVSGLDALAIRKSYEATFPSTEMLREKLGLTANDPPPGMPASAPSSYSAPSSRANEPMVPSSSNNNQSTRRHPAEQRMSSQPPSGSVSSEKHISSKSSTSNEDLSDGQSHATESKSSSTNCAVTPSPHSTTLSKSSSLMKEPLMSPSFAMGESPSADSILDGSGTPFSMPGSSFKMSATKFTPSATKTSCEMTPEDLGAVASNIFPSPSATPGEKRGEQLTKTDLNEASEPREEGQSQKKEADKGKGDLAAASALLILNDTK